MIRYSVACRGSMNEKSAKCFGGGGWWSDTPSMKCPHCGNEMFLTSTMLIIPVGPER